MFNWKDYFAFSKKERNAVLVLVMLILLIVILPYLVPRRTGSTDQEALRQFREQVALLKPVPKDSFRTAGSGLPAAYNRTYPDKPNRVAATLFYFDPNTLPAAGWRKLGLAERTVQTIIHYREKGGRFRKPEDLGKIYSLHKEEVEKLLPFVRMSNTINEAFYKPKEATQESHSFIRVYKLPYADLSIDINHTDSATLELLPGIGSKLAVRILSFRKKLGGFYAVDQVAETYGLPDSTFQKIKSHLKVLAQEVKTININTADASQLKQHPYIRWNIANALIQYRQQHGSFQSKADLLQVALITAELYKKLEPYITIE